MPVHEKRFTLTHIMDNLDTFVDDSSRFSEASVHFGIPWQIGYFREDDSLNIAFDCLHPDRSRFWNVDAEFEYKVISEDGTTVSLKNKRTFGHDYHLNTEFCWAWHDVMSWERLMKYYVVDGKAKIEVEVKILKTWNIGSTGSSNMRFSETNKYSDGVLLVGESKFHVMKSYLAYHSSYFESLFFGEFEEAKQEEVVLKKVHPDDFQAFLGVIHGESSINDSNIDGILHLADMYLAPTATNRCEEFLIKESKWAESEKLELAEMYNLETLKEKCALDLERIETEALINVQTVTPEQSVSSDGIIQEEPATNEPLTENAVGNLKKDEEDVFLVFLRQGINLCELSVNLFFNLHNLYNHLKI